MTVAIAIPVYRAAHETAECLAAVRAFTPSETPVFIVDDGSNDAATHAALAAAETLAPPSWRFVRRPNNLGFVRTVNEALAMRQPGDDVIILNSDTRVTRGWYSGLLRAQRLLPRVGSLTPWSNAATICSLFQYCQEQPLPPGWDENDIQGLLGRLSPRAYPELPTGVGFCMLMSGKALDELGYFDADTFGRGYGEENDWCMRTAAAGYRHYLADDVFVYHKGSASFSGERAERIVHAERALRARWPTYFGDVHRWIEAAPNRAFITIMAERIASRTPQKRTPAERPRVVHVLHADPRGERVPGTEYHVQELARATLDTYESWWLWNGDGAYLACNAEYPNEVLRWDRRAGYGDSGAVFYDPSWEEVFLALRPKTVHVHHSMRWDPAFLSFLTRRWPTVATVHDYYWLCPRHNLINAGSGQYCGLPTAPEVCETCLRGSAMPVTIAAWRHAFLRGLSGIGCIITPSAAARAVFLLGHPSLGEKTSILPHPASAPAHRPSVTPRHGGLRVLVLGYHSPEKGTGLLQEIARAMPETTFVSLGEVREETKEVLPANLVLAGGYSRSELPDKLRQVGCHVALFLSVWPETFSYTLSETWSFGLPAIVPDFGAPADRVKDAGVGWTYSPHDMEALFGALRHARDDDQDRTAKARAALATPPSLTPAEFSARLSGIYTAAAARFHRRQISVASDAST